ncbi:MAG TPA: flagellar filament capping protein FliD [Syntrophomonadaceae bacterium]|nr:flagellar filament capping protein FliD [Syntrophomonadaceae bacterium]
MSSTTTSGVTTTSMANGTTVTRLSGMASGIDTSSIVNSLVSVQKQSTVDPLTQKKQILEWEQGDYRTVNTKLLALQNSAFDLTLQGTFNAKKVSSANETALTATASAAAVNGTYSIQVESLASGVSEESTPTVDSSYTYSGSDQSFTLTGKKGSATITVTSGDTISSIVGKINDQYSLTGIKATYDSGQNKFYLMTTDTGSNAKIEVTDTDNFLSSVLNVNTTSQTGKDAKIKFNGGSEMSFSSNQFTFNNISFNLKQSGQTTNVTVGTDTDAIYNKIKAFVDAYNNVLSDISGRLSETRYRDYKPLTDDQKKSMTDTQITQWTDKAKSGLLRGDSLLINASSDIRSDAMGQVSGLSDSTYTSLSSIGINTENYEDNGKLVIDDDTLKAALAANPEAVMNLFTTKGTGSTDTMGIAQRVYADAKSNISLIKDRAGSAADLYDSSNLGDEMRELDNRTTTANDRLTAYETRLWAQYDAMETALEKLNSQSSYITSLLGSNSNSSS